MSQMEGVRFQSQLCPPNLRWPQLVASEWTMDLMLAPAENFSLRERKLVDRTQQQKVPSIPVSRKTEPF
jgi:hypothetical protein